MQAVGDQCPGNPQEAMREIAQKVWNCPVSKVRDAMREARVEGTTKILIIPTPAGVVTITFLTSPEKIGFIIRAQCPGWICFEFKPQDFTLDANQDKLLMSIANMSCDWGIQNYVGANF